MVEITIVTFLGAKIARVELGDIGKDSICMGRENDADGVGDRKQGCS